MSSPMPYRNSSAASDIGVEPDPLADPPGDAAAWTRAGRRLGAWRGDPGVADSQQKCVVAIAMVGRKLADDDMKHTSRIHRSATTTSTTRQG